MSNLVVRHLASWRDSAIASVLRALRLTPSASFVRLIVLVTGIGALWMGLFAGRANAIGWLVVAAGAVAAVVFPGSRYVLALELIAVLGWAVQTTGLGQAVTWGGLTFLAGTLYLHHLACALAAQLPFDAIVPWPALGRWLLRALAVVAVTGVFAFGVVELAPRTRSAGTVVVPVLGIVLVAGVLGMLAYLYRKGPAGSNDPAGPSEQSN